MQQGDLRAGGLDQQRLEGDDQRGPLAARLVAVGQHLGDALVDQRRHRLVEQAFVGVDDRGGLVDLAEPEEIVPLAAWSGRRRGAQCKEESDSVAAKARVDSLVIGVSLVGQEPECTRRPTPMRRSRAPSIRHHRELPRQTSAMPQTQTNPFATQAPMLCGPLRQPRQMLAEQKYDGHKSIHDDAMAEGWACAPARSKGRRTSASSCRCCSTSWAGPGSRPAASARTTRTWWSRARRCAPSSQLAAGAAALRAHLCREARRHAGADRQRLGRRPGRPAAARDPAAHRQAASAHGPRHQPRPEGRAARRGGREDPHGLRPAHGRPLPVHAGRQARRSSPSPAPGTRANRAPRRRGGGRSFRWR